MLSLDRQLVEATKAGNLRKVRNLLDLDHQLILAAQRGDLKRVRFLLDRGAGYVFDSSQPHLPKKDRDRLLWIHRALASAAEGGHLKVVKLLAERGADVQAGLMWAAKMGRTRVVKFLLDQGAAVDGDEHDSGTPLQWATDYGRFGTVRLLLNRGARNDLLWMAASKGHLEIARLMLQRGADVHAKDNFALCTAVRNGRTEMVKLLTEYVKDGRRLRKWKRQLKDCCRSVRVKSTNPGEILAAHPELG